MFDTDLACSEAGWRLFWSLIRVDKYGKANNELSTLLESMTGIPATEISKNLPWRIGTNHSSWQIPHECVMVKKPFLKDLIKLSSKENLILFTKIFVGLGFRKPEWPCIAGIMDELW